MPSNSKGRALEAAERMDWQQVAANGGPPCFHIDAECIEPQFCGRAQRWAGHSDKPDWPNHKFVSLADLLLAFAQGETESLQRIIDQQNSERVRSNEENHHNYNYIAERERKALKALRAWEHWYNVDSTEINRDDAREMGLKVLESAQPAKGRGI